MSILCIAFELTDNEHMKKNVRTEFNFDLPKLKYNDGEKAMVSIRMPVKMWAKLESVAKDKGWDRSDLVKTVLDLYLQQEESKKR